jgi:membrane protease YdiL (CAAX protease family)
MRTIEQAPAGFPEHPPPLGWSHTLAVFGAAAAVLFVGTRVLIPHLSRATGLEPVVSWFLVGGLVVFVPLILTGALLLRREHATGDPRLWSRRLRFRRMNRGDWLWGIGALLAIGVLSAGIQRVLTAVLGEVTMHPPFMAFEPLSAGRYWILLAWVPFWLLNIMGEELLWRGVMLPRQEVALGRRAWLANGCGWLLFHVAMGWQLLLVLAPILFILPYVTQRRKNTWVAVLIHAGLNGPGFVAVALGLA